jgi:transposase
MKKELNLDGFYPDYMIIEEIDNSETKIKITMRSISTTAICPECCQASTRQHSYNRREIHDLPILGKPVLLNVSVWLYYCGNDSCETKFFNEYLRNFANNRGQWTQRCETFIMSIALNTSCEAAASICKKVGVPVSGDTVIRMLLRNTTEKPYNGMAIGVDDWAYKKGHTYGTLICDQETGRPIALFDGRDGDGLKEWLKNNKQVKIITRDRASAYAAAISEILPEATQIADRFHLFQNLLQAVKDAIKLILPSQIKVLTEMPMREDEQDKKKRILLPA